VSGDGVAGKAKTIEVYFYRTAAGAEPVRDWLRSLHKADRQAIGADIATVEHGWPIGMPVCRPLDHGLKEVRTNLSDGRIARVIFSIEGGEMALLHGFIKKTRKTPKADLDLARKRKKELDR
jgi:phage-related protein